LLASFAGSALKLRSFLAVKAEVLSPDFGRLFEEKIIHPVAGTMYLLLWFVTVFINMTRLVSSLYSTHPKMAGWRPT
jgi:hypothetical protein